MVSYATLWFLRVLYVQVYSYLLILILIPAVVHTSYGPSHNHLLLHLYPYGEMVDFKKVFLIILHSTARGGVALLGAAAR
jgi:hypothetical protein